MNKTQWTPTGEVSGAGLGLRSNHYQHILDSKPDVPWFELLSDNYMSGGGLPIARAEAIRDLYPVTLHGVGMSLGSIDPLNLEYMKRLKLLVDRLEPVYVSDHIAWVSVDGKYTHDLLPLPYTLESKQVVVDRISQAQELLGRQILVENPSSYLAFNFSDMDEQVFLTEVVAESGCGILLDVNNVYVSSMNHGFSAEAYLMGLPKERVKEIHLAGYEQKGSYLFDTHGHRVHQPVWELYQKTLELFGAVPTLVEWDTDVPEFEVLQGEAQKAQFYLDKAR
ncbi:hypothetical protein A9Q99_19685 [Gammaproteobacteria bacterium 45_16_T64]|nr:hypothetical protein A9Q99_19685 [Gammaproteobacteria bacterium 45_16_T64]